MDRTEVSFIDDWIQKVWNIYTVEYYSAIRKDEILPLALESTCSLRIPAGPETCSMDVPPLPML